MMLQLENLIIPNTLIRSIIFSKRVIMKKRQHEKGKIFWEKNSHRGADYQFLSLNWNRIVVESEGMESEGEYSRSLGWLEEEAIDLYCLTVAEIDIVLQSEMLKKAVESTQNRYPNLSINLNRQVIPVQFRSVNGKVPFNLLSMHTSEFASFLETTLNSEFNISNEMPLWKVYVVYIKDENITKLCIVYSHGIGDATSGQIMINDVLSNYQQLEECSSHDNLLIQRQSLNFLPNIEDLSGITLKDGCIEKTVDTLLTVRQDWKPSISIGESMKTASGTSLNSFVLKEIQPHLLHRLKLLCKMKGITMGALLLTALHFGIAKLANLDEIFVIPWTFEHDVDANLRDRISPPLGDEHVALLIGMFSLSLTLESVETTFWQCANKVSESLHTAINDKLPLSYHIISRLLNENPEVKEKLEENYHPELNFSNVGVYKFNPNFKRFSIQSLHTIGNYCGPFVGAHCFLIQTINDKLCFSWTYEKNDKNKKAAELLMSWIENILECISKGDNEDLSINEFLSTNSLL